MKNKFSRLLLLALLGPALLVAKERKKCPDELNIVRLSEIVAAIETGMPVSQFRNIVIECPEGAQLPIKMVVRGDIFSLEPNLVTIKLLKTCYLKTCKGPLLISTDLKDWKESSDFFATQVAGGLEFHGQTLQINLELDLNQNMKSESAPISLKEAQYRQLFYWSSMGITPTPYYQDLKPRKDRN